jgi:hypothetical protein
MAWWTKSDSEPRDLPEKQFAALAGRILDVAVKDTTANDAITATAKALGSIIGITAKRPDVSLDELLKFANEAVEEYARAALGVAQDEASSTTKKLQKSVSSFIDIIATDKNPNEIQASAIALSSLAGFVVGFASVRGDGGKKRPQELLISCEQGFRKAAEKAAEEHRR